MKPILITLSTHVTLSDKNYALICACAKDLSLSEEEVLQAVVNTAVRRHFDLCFSSSDEVEHHE